MIGIFLIFSKGGGKYRNSVVDIATTCLVVCTLSGAESNNRHRSLRRLPFQVEERLAIGDWQLYGTRTQIVWVHTRVSM